MADSLGTHQLEISTVLVATPAASSTGGSGVFRLVMTGRLNAATPLIGIGSGYWALFVESALSVTQRAGEPSGTLVGGIGPQVIVSGHRGVA